MARHGTLTGYSTDKCRCGDCRVVMRDYQRKRRGSVVDDRIDVENDPLARLLAELFPLGLTDDCPARGEMQ